MPALADVRICNSVALDHVADAKGYADQALVEVKYPQAAAAGRIAEHLAKAEAHLRAVREEIRRLP